jgi:hypothetical protein
MPRYIYLHKHTHTCTPREIFCARAGAARLADDLGDAVPGALVLDGAPAAALHHEASADRVEGVGDEARNGRRHLREEEEEEEEEERTRKGQETAWSARGQTRAPGLGAPWRRFFRLEGRKRRE